LAAASWDLFFERYIRSVAETTCQQKKKNRRCSVDRFSSKKTAHEIESFLKSIDFWQTRQNESFYRTVTDDLT